MHRFAHIRHAIVRLHYYGIIMESRFFYLFCHSYSVLASDLPVSGFLCMLLHSQIIIVHCSHKSMPLVIQRHVWKNTNIDSQNELDQLSGRSEIKWRPVEH